MNTNRRSHKSAVPRSMATQLARLFGSASIEAKATERTDAEWKRTLRRVLAELERYLDANVTTDEPHRYMLQTGLWAAAESLKERDFWPGYAEGITRFALLLLGDYPDHRARRLHGKSSRHYDLDRCRSVSFRQSHRQKLETLFVAHRFGLPKLSVDPYALWGDYVVASGSKTTAQSFLNWYRKHHPNDYAAVF